LDISGCIKVRKSQIRHLQNILVHHMLNSEEDIIHSYFHRAFLNGAQAAHTCSHLIRICKHCVKVSLTPILLKRRVVKRSMDALFILILHPCQTVHGTMLCATHRLHHRCVRYRCECGREYLLKFYENSSHRIKENIIYSF